MSELFQEYRGKTKKGTVLAAAQVQAGKVKELSQITGWTAVAHKVRGGSMVLSELIWSGMSAKVGDYIVADRGDTFFAIPKEFFEERFELHGPLRSTERR